MYETLIHEVKAHIDSRKKEGDQILVKGWAFSESRGICPIRCKYDATIRGVDIESRQDVCDLFRRNHLILAGWKVRVPVNKYVDLQIKLGSDWTTFMTFHTVNHQDQESATPATPTSSTNISVGAPITLSAPFDISKSMNAAAAAATTTTPRMPNEIVIPPGEGNLEHVVQEFLQDFIKRNPHVNPATTTVNIINIATNNTTLSNVYVVDNFYENPDDIRKIALSSLQTAQANNFVNEVPLFKKQFEKIMGVSLGPFTKYEKNGAFSCNTMHDDAPSKTVKEHQYEGVVFLSPQISPECGVKLYRKTTDTDPIDEIGNVYNRLVIFNARMPHLHGPYWGNHAENGRLVQTFAFDLE